MNEHLNVSTKNGKTTSPFFHLSGKLSFIYGLAAEKGISFFNILDAFPVSFK